MTTARGVWVAYRVPRPAARVRLFCVPYAGGGPGVYLPWQKAMGQAIEICPVQLPGRGERFIEPPFVRMAPLVAALHDGIAPLLRAPYALFGHSMGALVAFELARAIRRAGGPQPLYLLVAGRRGPRVGEKEPPMHQLPEPELWERVLRYGGTPEELLKNTEVREFYLRVLRADLAACETYAYEPGPPLDCPLFAAGGIGDTSVTADDLQAWTLETSGPSDVQMYEGDHFFIRDAQHPVVAAVMQRLLGVVA